MGALASIATVLGAGASIYGTVRQVQAANAASRAQARIAEVQEQARRQELLAQRQAERAERQRTLARTIAAARARLAAGGVAPDAYTGTYGFTGAAVDYAPGATRAGGTVLPLHQAAAALGTPRLIAAAENVRSRAFRNTAQVAGGIGFEQMAVLSSNPAGPPTTLSGFCFGGLGGIGLNADSVQLPTSRALAFVVDCSRCKEFFLAVEGDNMRPVFLQFDASETLLGPSVPLLLSNANVVWDPAGTARWWEMNANLDSLTGGVALNRLQRVTFHASARYGVIGVRGGDSANPEANLLRAFRLYCPGTEAPPLVYGGSRAWGVREFTASLDLDPPSIAAGGTFAQTVTLPGAAPGDFVEVAWSNATLLQFLGHVSSSGPPATVSVRIWNPTGAAVDLGPGTVFVRAVKPRL